MVDGHEMVTTTCEGSANPGRFSGYPLVDRTRINCAICSFKGTPLNGDIVPEHQRDDWLAMQRRGDYDGGTLYRVPLTLVQVIELNSSVSSAHQEFCTEHGDDHWCHQMEGVLYGIELAIKAGEIESETRTSA